MTPQELSRLDYESASDMLLAYATDAKKYEKDIALLRTQAAEWMSRVQRARERGLEDLAAQAEHEAQSCRARAQELEHELAGLRRDIEDLRTALPILKAKRRSVDPDLLLAELSMLVGQDEQKPTGTVESPQAEAESKPAVDDALAELKKKMGLL